MKELRRLQRVVVQVIGWRSSARSDARQDNTNAEDLGCVTCRKHDEKVPREKVIDVGKVTWDERVTGEFCGVSLHDVRE